MASQLEEPRQEGLLTLELGINRVAACLFLAAADGRPEDWRLLGRSLGRVERELAWHLTQIQNLDQLRQAAERCLDERLLEAQVKEHLSLRQGARAGALP